MQKIYEYKSSVHCVGVFVCGGGGGTLMSFVEAMETKGQWENCAQSILTAFN